MTALIEGPVDDVSTESFVLSVDGVAVPAYHARPDGMPSVGVVLHPDLMGLRPLFEDMARRLATHGLAVVTLEPFAHVPGWETLTSPEQRFGALPGMSDAVQISDLEAAADHLVIHDDVSRVAVLGFCMGGYMTFKAAAGDRFDRAVAFYGMLHTPDAWQGPGLGDPIDVIGDVCPTLAVFGTADPWVPSADVAALRAAWSGRPDCEIIEIEGADHGFVHDPERPVHRADDAARCWARALDWITTDS